MFSIAFTSLFGQDSVHRCPADAEGGNSSSSSTLASADAVCFGFVRLPGGATELTVKPRLGSGSGALRCGATPGIDDSASYSAFHESISSACPRKRI